MARTAEIVRNTLETQISLTLDLDGTGVYDIDTGCGFLNQMLILFAKHGRFNLTVKCTGDTDVDYHHTTEDIGIALGDAFRKALGDKRGIIRYSDITLPMDEALILAAVDVSGRAHLTYDVTMPTEKVGDFDTELAKEFWLGFIRAAEITLHVRMLSAKIRTTSSKAFSRRFPVYLRKQLPSTRGMRTKFRLQKACFN